MSHMFTVQLIHVPQLLSLPTSRSRRSCRCMRRARTRCSRSCRRPPRVGSRPWTRPSPLPSTRTGANADRSPTTASQDPTIESTQQNFWCEHINAISRHHRLLFVSSYVKGAQHIMESSRVAPHDIAACGGYRESSIGSRPAAVEAVMARLSNAGASRNSSAMLAPVPEGRASTATSLPAAPMPAAASARSSSVGLHMHMESVGKAATGRRCNCPAVDGPQYQRSVHRHTYAF